MYEWEFGIWQRYYFKLDVKDCTMNDVGLIGYLIKKINNHFKL